MCLGVVAVRVSHESHWILSWWNLQDISLLWVLVLVEGSLVFSMDWFQRRWLSRLLFWNALKWVIVNKKLLIFLHFSARQVPGTCRRFLVAPMYSTLESPPHPEPWPCFSLLSLKAAQHGLVMPWGCADTHRLCWWVWKDSSPLPHPVSWSWERGKGSHFSDWANRDLQQNECYPPNAVPAQVLNHSAFYTRTKF